jgi:hypothetical protein
MSYCVLKKSKQGHSVHPEEYLWITVVIYFIIYSLLIQNFLYPLSMKQLNSNSPRHDGVARKLPTSCIRILDGVDGLFHIPAALPSKT